MVTKRSGRETALISRRCATVEQTRWPRLPGKDQGNNKPSTNWTLRHTDSNSRTRRVRIFRFPAGPINIITKSPACLRPACLIWRLAGPSAGQTVKELALAKSTRVALQRQAAIAASARHSRTSSPNPRPVGPAPCLKPGLAGPSVGQTVKELALAKSPRAALLRQAAIAAVARADRVLVNAPLQAPNIERPAGPLSDWLRPLSSSVAVPTDPSAIRACPVARPTVPAKTDRQSIIAALRMHTMVAWAGFSLRLRIR